MKYFWRRFKKDRFFLFEYFVLQTFVVGILSTALLYWNLTPDLVLNPVHFLYIIPFAFWFGVKIPTIMHNCTHNNLGGLNFVIGELTSFFILMSFGIVSINHTFHHAFSDSELDPHSPEGKSFLQFFFTALISGAGIIQNKFLEFHGNKFVNRRLFDGVYILHYMGIALKMFLWYLILGDALFMGFYLPAFFTYLFCFAHVNYITHSFSESGEAIILNKNSNIWYKLINLIGDGIYFHKNHHENPGLYNPRFSPRGNV